LLIALLCFSFLWQQGFVQIISWRVVVVVFQFDLVQPDLSQIFLRGRPGSRHNCISVSSGGVQKSSS
jgi:hypothetical protein